MCAPPAFLVIFEWGLGRGSKRHAGHAGGRWKKALKNTVLWNLHRDITFRITM